MAIKINYRSISKDELDQILEAHKKWVESKGEEGKMADLSGVDLERFNLRGVLLSAANLINTDLVKADLRLSNLQGANLQGANLQGANLQGANLQGANLQGTSLIDAILQRANLQEANSQRADLRLGSIQGADLQRVDLQSADLQGASLQGAKLQGAKFQGSNLQGVGLQGADLQGANLQGANLQDANLQGANLIEAHFKNADLEGAHIRGCVGYNANVEGTKLFIDQIEDLNAWSDSIKNKTRIHFRFREGEPIEYPHVLYMLFPGYDNLVEVLKELEKAPQDSWTLKAGNFQNRVLYYLEVMNNNILSLIGIGHLTLSQIENINDVITNFPELIGRIQLSIEEQGQALKELIAHDSQLVRDLVNTIQELNENNLPGLVDTLSRIDEKGVKTTFEDKTKLAGLLREGLERNQGKQKFRDTLKSLLPNFAIGAASSATVTALTASGGIDVNAAMLAGGGLLGWALAVINQYLEPPTQVGNKQIPLMGWDGEVFEDEDAE